MEVVTNKIKVRRYADGDGEGLNALYNLVFDKRRSLRSWRLKFKNALASTTFSTCLAEIDGMIIGMYPVLISNFKLADREISIGLPVEISVHPDFRSASLIYRLKQEATVLGEEVGVFMAIGFPTQAHVKIGRGYLGYDRLGSFPILHKSCGGFERTMNPLCQRILRRPLGLFRRLYRGFKFTIGRLCQFSSIEVKEVRQFDDSLDLLWEEVKGEYQVIRVRKKEYLNWKYFGNREESFKVYSAIIGNRTCGYVALTVRNEGKTRMGYVYDLFGQDDEIIVKALLLRGLSYLVAEGVDCMKCGVLENSPLYRQLIAEGFQRSNEHHDIVYRILDENADRKLIENLDNWYLTLSETDWLGW